jgi:hypothetical protein
VCQALGITSGLQTQYSAITHSRLVYWHFHWHFSRHPTDVISAIYITRYFVSALGGTRFKPCANEVYVLSYKRPLIHSDDVPRDEQLQTVNVP